MTDEIDKLRAHVEALSNRTGDLRETIQELERENSHLRDRVAQLERVINPDPEGKDFEDMGRDEKVYKLRSKLVALAESNGGKYRMKYRDVKNFFNGHPSPGHTYDLMQLAGEMEGFEYDTDRSDEKRVRVNLEGVNDEAFVRAANKTQEGTPA